MDGQSITGHSGGSWTALLDVMRAFPVRASDGPALGR